MKQMLTLASLFFFVATVRGQAPATSQPSTPAGGTSPFGSHPAKKSGLETAIDLALANNPDLRVADAKVREAEASMSRTRLQVLQKVVAAYQGVEDAKAAVKHAEQRLARARQLAKSAAISAQEVGDAEAAVSQAKSKQAAAQAELDYLQGKAAAKKATGYFQEYQRAADPSRFSLYSVANQASDVNTALAFYDIALLGRTVKAQVEGPVADRLRKALEKKVTLKVRETDARSFLAFLREQASGLHIQASEKGPAWDEKVTATVTEVPLSAALQLLEDVLGDYRVVVRDYGLYIAPKATTPAGATTLADFLRASTTAETKPVSQPSK